MSTDSPGNTNICIIQVGKDFTVRNLAKIQALAQRAIDAQAPAIVFDMSECAHIDSSAISLLTMLHGKCAHFGGKIGFLNPTGAAEDLIYITNVESFFHIYHSEEEIRADL